MKCIIEMQKKFSTLGISKVNLVNDMSAISINGCDGDEIILSLNGKTRVEPCEFCIEDFAHTKVDGETLSISLEKLDIGTEYKLEAKLELPATVALSITNENYPIAIHKLESKLQIENENGPIAINECSATIEVKDENGPLRIHKHSGDLNVTMENGPLSAEKISGSSLKISSENGPIKIREAQYPGVSITNENGAIYYQSMPVNDANFSFENENGIISLVLPVNFDFDMEVETEYGTLKSKLDAVINRDNDKYYVRNGEGNNKIKIVTENGSIKLSTDESINLDFVKQKLEQIKTLIAANISEEDREQVSKLLQNLAEYLNKNLSSINEESIRAAVNSSLEKLKEQIQNLDLQDTKEKLSAGFEELSSSIMKELNAIYTQVKSKIESDFPKEKIKNHINDQMHEIFDKDHFKKMFAPLKKFKNFGFDLSETDKQNIQDRSRIKILEMLEAGKITSEEAERLLKAMNKE